LRVGHPDADLSGPELDPADVELVAGRRRLADEIEQRGAARGEQRDNADEEQERDKRP
jgi:hypothetical protein